MTVKEDVRAVLNELLCAAEDDLIEEIRIKAIVKLHRPDGARKHFIIAASSEDKK